MQAHLVHCKEKNTKTVIQENMIFHDYYEILFMTFLYLDYAVAAIGSFYKLVITSPALAAAKYCNKFVCMSVTLQCTHLSGPIISGPIIPAN